MRSRPFPDELTRCRRPDLAGEKTTGEVEGGVLSLMFRMKVPGFVIIEVHPNDDPEKCGDDRLFFLLATAATDSLTFEAERLSPAAQLLQAG